jgi:hypothetical protein
MLGDNTSGACSVKLRRLPPTHKAEIRRLFPPVRNGLRFKLGKERRRRALRKALGKPSRTVTLATVLASSPFYSFKRIFKIWLAQGSPANLLGANLERMAVKFGIEFNVDAVENEYQRIRKREAFDQLRAGLLERKREAPALIKKSRLRPESINLWRRRRDWLQEFHQIQARCSVPIESETRSPGGLGR